MTINSARFITSMSAYQPFDGCGLPEIAACGKSNVGKSSLINSLGRSKKLAKVSSEPGKTRLINAYDFEQKFILIDLPGYGFAKAPIGEKNRWGAMIEGYLTGSKSLRHVLMLVDIRHSPTEGDQTLVNYLRHYGIGFSVIATKADKLSRAQCSRCVPQICRALAVQPWDVLPYSSETGAGRDLLLDKLSAIIARDSTSGV